MMMAFCREARACPFCRRRDVSVIQIDGVWTVRCNHCRCVGPQLVWDGVHRWHAPQSWNEAVVSWNGEQFT